MTTEWDYIVLGAGSAGCAVVHHLVQTGKRVLLIEAGGDDRKLAIKLPFLMLRALDIYDWGYVSAPDESRHRRSERWQRGKVLGGTSSVNGMIYVRGSKADYDLWAAESDETWSASNIMALYREMERCDPGSIRNSTERGYCGPLRVRKVSHAHRTARAFVNSMLERGYPFVSDYNGPAQEGVGYTQLTQYRGRRFSAFDAFVRPRMHTDNLRIMSECFVKKIDIEDGRATGVTIEQGGVEKSIRGAKVVLSAGSINSPKILMLSGIGDALELSRLGIEVKLERAAVGRGLTDHPLVRIAYEMRVPTYAFDGVSVHSAGLLAKYLILGEGLLASAHEAMAFVRSSPEQTEADLQLHFAPIGVAMDRGTNQPQLMKTPSAFISIKKNRPRSKGVVRLRSSDPFEAPIIEPNLLGDMSDSESIVQGIRILRDIMQAAPMRNFVKRELPGSAKCQSAAALSEYVKQNATIACHSVGTCRMGQGEEAVVDPGLRVRGISNLWIADASIMPYNISGNTNAPSMMIGYKLGKALASMND